MEGGGGGGGAEPSPDSGHGAAPDERAHAGKEKRPDPHGEENKAQYKIEFQTVCACVAAQLFSKMQV